VQVRISWRKNSRKPPNFYKKLVKRLPCEEIGKQDLRKKKCADFSKEATPEVTKEEPIMEKLEQEHIVKNYTKRRLRRTKGDEQEKHVKRKATKGVRTNGLGSY
jgi:hypothetical protein